MPALLDHLVFSSRDLQRGIDHVESLLGVSVAPGGRHEGKGTCNVLIGFGEGAYIEVLGADPERSDPDGPRWLGVDAAIEPVLATWCARATDLQEIIEVGRRHGIELGETSSGSRRKADGSTVAWTVTDPNATRFDGVVPFFIDWGDTPHPSIELDHPCTCVALRIEHPHADQLAPFFSEIGLDVQVTFAESARLRATIECPAGIVELR